MCQPTANKMDTILKHKSHTNLRISTQSIHNISLQPPTHMSPVSYTAANGNIRVLKITSRDQNFPAPGKNPI